MVQASTHGSTINAAKCPKDRPLAANASRLVRFDTGSSSEPLFARCVQAYACGRAAMRMRCTVVSTTGVSSTTVASRVSTAVTEAASTTTSTSSRRGRPPLACAARTPR